MEQRNHSVGNRAAQWSPRASARRDCWGSPSAWRCCASVPLSLRLLSAGLALWEAFLCYTAPWIRTHRSLRWRLLGWLHRPLSLPVTWKHCHWSQSQRPGRFVLSPAVCESALLLPRGLTSERLLEELWVTLGRSGIAIKKWMLMKSWILPRLKTLIHF